MDAKSQQAISLSNAAFPDGRWAQHADGLGGTYYTITFRDPQLFPNDWETPVRVRVIARDDPRREDPQTAVIRYTCETTTAAQQVCGKVTDFPTRDLPVPEPALRPGPSRRSP